MSPAHFPGSLPVPPDSLAVAGTGVLGAGVEMQRANDTQARLQRNKERLYVVCQLGGWGLLLLMQVGLSQALGGGRDSGPDGRVTEISSHVIFVLLGLLATHYARRLIVRWGWRELGWRRLAPRVLLLAIGLAVVWCAIGFGYLFGIVGQPWLSKHSLLLIFGVNCLQTSMLLACWLCLYFVYHIFERLNRLQVEQLSLRASVKEAELRALKSQINPHFLFNSLNSLRALIDEDAPRARESVTRLANMLRYSLQSGQLETVPLEDELRIVEDYLALEQIRHENRLRVRWEISDDVRRQAVPPMLLQTLVENAVKYGISVRRTGGELAISARVEGGQVHIRVTNPGDLHAPASPSAARAGSSTGVGLRNASERLKLLFGERASLQLGSGGADLVTADVCLPLKPVLP